MGEPMRSGGTVAVTCECCGIPWPSTQKYKGIGYWCDICMNEGCFGDDIDAQNPSGQPPYYERRDVNHARMVALFGSSAAGGPSDG